MIRAELVVRGLSELATPPPGAAARGGPLQGRVRRLPDAAVAVDGGRFVWVGAAQRLRSAVRLRRGGRAIDGGGGTLVPGFVDAHSHVLFAGERSGELAEKAAGRSYPEIAQRGGGLYSTVRSTRQASDARLVLETVDRLRRMAASGTTSIEVKSGYALDHAGELRLLALVPRLARAAGLTLVPTYLGAHAVPPEHRRRPDAYVDEMVDRTIPEVGRRGLARFCDVFCEPGFFSVAQAERVLRAGARAGLGLKVHAEEFVRSGGAALAARLRATSADHLLAASPGDRRALARAGVAAVLLPFTALGAGPSGRVPARAFVDAGVPVALGSDCSPNSWVESMPAVIAAAVHGGRLSPAEALVAATVNAARAVGLPEAGTVGVGAPADFSVLPVPSADQLGYRFELRPTLVYRQGKSVLSG